MIVFVEGDINISIKLLKKKLEKDGFARLLKRKLSFPKPSERRKDKEAFAVKRLKRSGRRRIRLCQGLTRFLDTV